MEVWNPWYGCHKVSTGCKNCYVYDRFNSYQKDANTVVKSKSFYEPIKKRKDGSFKIPSGQKIQICMTSDFLIEEADEWRKEIWSIIKTRDDLTFEFFTKRIERFEQCVPRDWGLGYNNVNVICSVEDQNSADYRLPIFQNINAAKKMIACSPLLESINIKPFLGRDISLVTVCGENGKHARPCDFIWVKNIRDQCIEKNTPFKFHKTGTFLVIEGKRYFIPFERQYEQAQKANINFNV